MPPTDPTSPKILRPPAPKLLVPEPTVDDPYGDTIGGLKVVKATSLTQDAFCALFYAHGGVGKTTIAGMFSDVPNPNVNDSCDTLIVDAEGGATAVANKPNVYVVSVKSWNDVTKIVEALRKTPKDKMRWGTVCFDNLSEFQILQLTTMTGGATAGVTQQQWGINTSEILSFARKTRDLARFKGINVIYLAWMEPYETRDAKGNVLKTEYKVALTKALRARMPGIVNVVGYMTIENNPPHYTRKISFRAQPNTDSKFRRAAGDSASPIPLDLWYNLDQNPIEDMLNTLYHGMPFPTAKYKRGGAKTEPEPEPTVTEGTISMDEILSVADGG